MAWFGYVTLVFSLLYVPLEDPLRLIFESKKEAEDDAAIDDMRQQQTDYPVTAVSNPVVQPPATIWDEQVDPQSGRTYYFNKSTAQTQWERPAEMDAPRTAAVSQPLFSHCDEL